MLEQLLGQLTRFLDSLSLKVWIVEIIVVLTATFLLYIIVKIIYAKLHPRLEKTANKWDDVTLYAVHKPLVTFIWIEGLALVALILASLIGQKTVLLNAIRPFQDLAVVLLLIWFAIRFISSAEKQLITRPYDQKHLDATTIYALGKIFRITVFALGGLVALQTLGIGISGLVAFGGISGAAVAFASKDLLANFFGGVIVYFDRPFKVGDWIRSPDREIEGTVVHIGWRVTRIRTFDKRPLYVPNSLFTTVSIENPSRMTNRRIKTNIGLRYDDAKILPVVLKDIEDMLRHHPEIDTNQTLMVNLIEFGPSSLDFFIYTFTKTTNWVKFQQIQQDVFMEILKIIDSHGAEVAFPTRTMHVPNGVQMLSEARDNVPDGPT